MPSRATIIEASGSGCVNTPMNEAIEIAPFGFAAQQLAEAACHVEPSGADGQYGQHDHRHDHDGGRLVRAVGMLVVAPCSGAAPPLYSPWKVMNTARNM